MSGGIAYVYDPKGRFDSLCNKAMVDLEKVATTADESDDEGRPRQRSVSAFDNGMGDCLRFDAERLRILIERHHLHTGSKRARFILENWTEALGNFVKVTPRDYRRALLELAAERDAARIAAAE
jgi:glutamate synthase (NADPH/NADH) large chain